MELFIQVHYQINILKVFVTILLVLHNFTYNHQILIGQIGKNMQDLQAIGIVIQRLLFQQLQMVLHINMILYMLEIHLVLQIKNLLLILSLKIMVGHKYLLGNIRTRLLYIQAILFILHKLQHQIHYT